MSDSIDFQQQRGRHADIIQEALATYDDWMLDDDYDAMPVLHKIMKRMQERLKMGALSPAERLDVEDAGEGQ